MVRKEKSLVGVGRLRASEGRGKEGVNGEASARRLEEIAGGAAEAEEGVTVKPKARRSLREWSGGDTFSGRRVVEAVEL